MEASLRVRRLRSAGSPRRPLGRDPPRPRAGNARGRIALGPLVLSSSNLELRGFERRYETIRLHGKGAPWPKAGEEMRTQRGTH